MTERPTYRYSKLTDKQQAFVDAFMGRTHKGSAFLNTARSARLAGYANSESNPYTQVRGNKRVASVIKQALDEYQMRDEEAAMIHARLSLGTLAPFLKIHPSGLVEIDLSSKESRANLHLLKKIKQNKVIKQYSEIDPDTGVSRKVTQAIIEHDIEIHDPGLNAERIRRAYGAYGAKGTLQDPIHTKVENLNPDLEKDLKDLKEKSPAEIHDWFMQTVVAPIVNTRNGTS